MAVYVYGDESEQTDPHVFTLAAWIAVPSAWDRFNEEWIDMLRTCGPSPARAFHTVELAHGYGQFANWSRDDRLKMMMRAGDIILDPAVLAIPYAVAATIVVDDFKRLDSAWQPTTADIYEFCWWALFNQVVGFPRCQYGIDLVFDEKAGVQGRVLERLVAARANINGPGVAPGDGLINECRFTDDACEPALQAADWLAYEVCLAVQRRISSGRSERRSFARLKKRPHVFRVYDNRFIDAGLERARATGKPLIECWRAVEAPEE